MCNFLSGFILAVVIVIVLALLVPRAFGYDIFAVLSGSMEPTYHVGSIVYVDKNQSPEEIKAGDPIAFYKEKGVVATHRAIETDKENKQFVTKGDANDSKDPEPISYQQFIGKAVLSIPLLGYVSIYIKTVRGMMVAIIVILTVILLYVIPELLKPKKEKEKRDEGI